MPRVSEIRTNFNAGELSSLVNARTNYERYFNGSEKIENFDVLLQGVLNRRKGTKYISEVKYNSKETRLIRFQFNVSQTYCLELGEGYLRFFSQQGRILENKTTITNATNTNPVLITDIAHPYNTNDNVVIKDVLGMTEINNKEYKITKISNDTYELQGIDGTSFNNYISGGSTEKIHEITSPYLENELLAIKYFQDGDVVYFVHQNYPIYKLIRISANSFTFSPIEFIKGPYQDQNIIYNKYLTLSGSTWTEGATLTMTATGHTPFTIDDVGTIWRIKEGSDVAHVKVISYNSSTVVTVEAKNDIPTSLRAVAKFTWSKGEFDNIRGYPSAIIIHEGRLILGGSTSSPFKLWFSASGDYELMEAGTNDGDAFIVKIGSNGDPIRWLLSDQVLFVGTSGSIFRVKNSNNSSAITPSDVDIKKHIAFGCSQVQPQTVGETPIYIQKNNITVRGISFSIDVDKYKSTDITTDADHITGEGITELSYQQIPTPCLWGIRKDGQIAKLILETDQQVQSWSRYTTQGKFKSIAIVSDAEENDEIYFIVERTINGVTKRFVEVQEPNNKVDDLNRLYLDCSLTYNGVKSSTLTLSNAIGSSVLLTEDGKVLLTEDEKVLLTENIDITLTSDIDVFSSLDVGKQINQLRDYGSGKAIIKSFIDARTITISIIESFNSITLNPNEWAIALNNITGLDHLEGQEVSIASDGATIPNQIVVNGSISLDLAGSIVHVGLSYNTAQKNLPLEASALGSIIGTSQHKDKKISGVVIRFYDSVGGKIIVNDKQIDIIERSSLNNMNETVPLFTGDKEITIAGNWDKYGQIEIVQNEPQPLNIKSITYKVTVNDK
jgi:hypothetical protein